MGSGFSKMKKQARMMQEQMSNMREEMQKKRFNGTSGNGLVLITLDGERKMREIKIKPECVDPEDIEGLEDLIQAAYTDASKQIDDEGDGDLGGIMPNLPF